MQHRVACAGTCEGWGAAKQDNKHISCSCDDNTLQTRGAMQTWVAYKGNAFQDADGSDDQSEVGRDFEGEVKGNLG